MIYWTWNNTLSIIQQYVIMKQQGVKVELWDNLRELFCRKTTDRPDADAPAGTAGGRRAHEPGGRCSRRPHATSLDRGGGEARAAAADAALPEIAFAGRSNVGKSSLINALTGRKTLARTSHTPGRTQQLNFFALGGPPGETCASSTCRATAMRPPPRTSRRPGRG